MEGLYNNMIMLHFTFTFLKEPFFIFLHAIILTEL
jgi:hypothetical protein